MTVFAISSCFVIFRVELIELFTHQQQIVEIGSQLMIISAIFIIGDYMQGCLAGTILAMGKQRSGSIINLVSYILIMLPISYILGFSFDLGVFGIYIGGIFGPLWVLCMYSYMICKTDWEQLSNEIYARIHKQNDELAVKLLEKDSQH